jgi:SAM-dependent methyltransferase
VTDTPKVPPDPVDEDAVLRALMARADAARLDWPQFRSLAGARQYRQLHRWIRAHVAPGGRVLDWGTGNGHFSFFLTHAGYRATAFSLEPRSQAAWLDEPWERFVAGAAAEPVRLPFEDAAFDAVASVGVLEHVRETGGREDRSLAEIARVLRPGGVFVCVHFPNRGSWIDALARRAGRHRHEWRYTRADITRLAHGAGLELLAVARYGVLPRNTLARLPRAWRDARALADAWDALDRALAVPLGPIAQNWGFVARRPGRP